MAAGAEEEKEEREEVVEEENDTDEGEGEGEEEDDAEEEEDEEEDGEVGMDGGSSSDREKMTGFLRRLSVQPVSLRVHDIVIKGNSRTRESLIEAEVINAFRSASTMQEVIQAASIANAKLRRLDIFDSVSITLDAGPPELPNTTNVVIEVVEARNPVTGDVGIFTKPEVNYSLVFYIMTTDNSCYGYHLVFWKKKGEGTNLPPAVISVFIIDDLVEITEFEVLSRRKCA